MLEGSLPCSGRLSVASGENEFTRWGFRDLIEQGGAEIVQADPGICGGIRRSLFGNRRAGENGGHGGEGYKRHHAFGRVRERIGHQETPFSMLRRGNCTQN